MSRDRAFGALAAVTCLVASSLVFALEPLAGRSLLPRLGGAPAVWITALAFFQVALLVGYAYAAALGRLLGPQRALALHAVVTALCVVALPLDLARAPVDPSAPVQSVALLLALGVGAPFVALAATIALVTRAVAPGGVVRPASLYAWSNAGSLAGLAAYPIVIEPALGLGAQAVAFRVGLAAVAALFAAVALSASPAARPAVAVASAGAPPSSATRAMWVALAAVGSLALAGVTTHVTTEVAPMPLLWVVPLGIYLGTFVIAFAARPLVAHEWALRLLPYAAITVAILLLVAPVDRTWVSGAAHFLAFAVVALACHGELARRAPAPERMVELYLLIAAGGALGGLCAAVVVPRVATWVVEYPAAVVAACVLCAPSAARARRPVGVDLVVAFAAGALVVVADALVARARLPDGTARDLLVVTPALLVALSAVRRPVRTGLVLAAVLLAAPRGHDVELETRSFFGVLRVDRVDAGRYRRFVHGTTTHGLEAVDPARRDEPLLYFTRSGPVGPIFGLSTARPRAHVAVLGLGAGALAAYARPGDELTFVEVDPAVRDIAEHRFSQLARARARGATVRVVIDDARLAMARMPAGRFDLIVVDAFSSDALATHLVTREAFGVYLRALGPRGLLAVNVSNRFVALDRVVGDVAARLGLAAVVRVDDRISRGELAAGRTRSAWAALARNSANLAALGSAGFRPLGGVAARAWSDDSTPLLSALK